MNPPLHELDTSELPRRLRAEGFLEDAYNLDGQSQDGTHVPGADAAGWRVWFHERGVRTTEADLPGVRPGPPWLRCPLLVALDFAGVYGVVSAITSGADVAAMRGVQNG